MGPNWWCLCTLAIVSLLRDGSTLSLTSALQTLDFSDCVAILLDDYLPDSYVRQVLQAVHIPYVLIFRLNQLPTFLGINNCKMRLTMFTRCSFSYQAVEHTFASTEFDVVGTVVMISLNPHCSKRDLLASYPGLKELKHLVYIKRVLTKPCADIPCPKRSDAIFKTIVFRSKPSNLQKTLRLALFHHEPSIILDQAHHLQRRTYRGCEVELIKTFTELHKFRLEYVDIPMDEKWGAKTRSGQWTGLIGKVNASQVDFGIGNVFMTPHYMEAVDMSYPFDTECAVFLVPGPVTTPRWQALVQPFSWQVWLLTFVVFVIIGISLPTLSEIYDSLVNKHPGGFYRRWGSAYFYSCQMVTGIASGGHDVGNPWPVRLYISVLWAFYFLLTTDYRAVLTAVLSFPSMTFPIDNGIQLLQSRIEWGGMEAVNVFKHSETPIDILLNRSFKVFTNADIQHGVNLVAEGKFALMENRRWVQFIVATSYQENLYVTRTCFSAIPVAVVLPRPSEIKPLLNRYIFRLKSTGLFDYWAETTAREGRSLAIAASLNITSRATEKDSLIFSLYKLQGAFYLLIFGYVPALLAFCCEKIQCLKRSI